MRSKQQGIANGERGYRAPLLSIPFATRRLPPHAIRKARAALTHPVLQEMLQWIEMRGGDIRIGGEIVPGIEIDRRIAAFLPAEQMILVERIDAGRRNVGVVRQVALDVEERVRVAALLPADRLEVLERI